MKKNAIVHKIIFKKIKEIIKDWLKLTEINEVCEKLAKKNNVLCWFKGVYWFPANVCISINDVVVHWLPRKNIKLKNWDLLTVDFGIKDKKKWINTDAAFSVIVWGDKYNSKWAKLIEINKKALYAWIDQCRVWNKVWDISNAIQTIVEWAWFYIVKSLTGHAIWKELHEKPYIPNYWKSWNGIILKKWMTLAIEPIIGETTWDVSDEWWWEIYMKDGCLWSQYEHTILITDWDPEIII
jgi:methionyl aminopeptidase